MSFDHQQLAESIADISARFDSLLTQPWLLVHIQNQRLYLIEESTSIHSYLVSTSKFGQGCKQDSFQTPLGAHAIARCIGGHEPLAMIFNARQATGEIASIINTPQATELDLITSRILWLRGKEPGINAGDGVDSYQRYIYIHGTHEEGLLGTPASHGCVRMANHDIIELYQRVAENTFVYIQ